MLVIHQAIEIHGIKVNLLSPMQIRDNDIHVNEEPKHMALTPTEGHHCIQIDLEGSPEPLVISIAIAGVTSYFPTRRLTQQEWDNSELHVRLELTSESIEWDPSTDRFAKEEAAMLDSNVRLISRNKVDWSTKRIVSVLHSNPQDSQPFDDFGEALKGLALTSSNVSAKTKRSIGALSTGKRARAVGPKTLAKNWSIGLAAATRTVEATTQNALRAVLHPTLSRRFRTNDRQLRYRRLSHDVFTDTLIAKVPSWFRRNKYAQVFATKFGWTRIYPMKKKSDAHDGLSKMAQRDGVPPLIVMDGAKEQTMGTFRKKAKEMGARVKQTEPYSAWLNACEGAIRETKRGAGRKMTKSRSPRNLWDHCMELEAFIRSHTALDQYELQGQVPETIMSGQTADISQFSEFAWYDWIIWWDTSSGFPEAKEVLGRWLGPAVDIGPAMTAKVLKQNGTTTYVSSYRVLNNHELSSPEKIKERDEFDVAIRIKLGEPVETEKDLGKIDKDAVTPHFDLYEDDTQPARPMPNIDEATPEELDNYVGAEITLPIGGTMRAGKVKRRALNNDGEVYGKRNQNPILDTRTYDVEFPDGAFGEYTANTIAENMYSQCDAEGRQSILMANIVDHKADETAVKREDAFVTVNGRQCPCKSTKGWMLCVQWKDGSASWEKLSDLKESYPVEVCASTMMMNKS